MVAIALEYMTKLLDQQQPAEISYVFAPRINFDVCKQATVFYLNKVVSFNTIRVQLI